MTYPNEIFVFFEYNGREMSGINQFKKELEKNYLTQGKDYSLPSYSEGGETWFTVCKSHGSWRVNLGLAQTRNKKIFP